VASPQDAKTFAPYFPNLQWIQSTWAGVDALTGHIPESVSITPLRGVFGQAMSEFVLGWILGLERNIIERARSSSWDATPETGVRGKLMGILGTGSIGSAIAEAVKPLGIKCQGMNSSGLPTAGFTQCFESNDLQFFEGLDYCVAVLPKTQATDHILSSRAFDAMSDQAIVINVGRGNAIDDDALLHALDNNNLRAAVLDVFTTEPLPEGHRFWQHPRVHITSHTAAPTAIDLVAIAMADNLERYLAGDTLEGLFIEAKGY
jgi:phosphoglycerate dehydrogenase-like enzyme